MWIIRDSATRNWMIHTPIYLLICIEIFRYKKYINFIRTLNFQMIISNDMQRTHSVSDLIYEGIWFLILTGQFILFCFVSLSSSSTFKLVGKQLAFRKWLVHFISECIGDVLIWWDCIQWIQIDFWFLVARWIKAGSHSMSAISISKCIQPIFIKEAMYSDRGVRNKRWHFLENRAWGGGEVGEGVKR